MTDLEPIIAENPFFKDFTKEHIAEFVGCAKNVAFQNGEHIFKEGGPANFFYIVRHGSVALDVFVPGKGTDYYSDHRAWRGCRLVVADPAAQVALRRALHRHGPSARS